MAFHAIIKVAPEQGGKETGAEMRADIAWTDTMSAVQIRADPNVNIVS